MLPYSAEELDPAYALGLLGWTQQPVYAPGGPLLPRLLDLANVLLSGGRNTLNGEYYGFTPYLVHMPLPGELLLITDVGGVLQEVEARPTRAHSVGGRRGRLAQGRAATVDPRGGRADVEGMSEFVRAMVALAPDHIWVISRVGQRVEATRRFLQRNVFLQAFHFDKIFFVPVDPRDYAQNERLGLPWQHPDKAEAAAAALASTALPLQRAYTVFFDGQRRLIKQVRERVPGSVVGVHVESPHTQSLAGLTHREDWEAGRDGVWPIPRVEDHTDLAKATSFLKDSPRFFRLTGLYRSAHAAPDSDVLLAWVAFAVLKTNARALDYLVLHHRACADPGFLACWPDLGSPSIRV